MGLISDLPLCQHCGNEIPASFGSRFCCMGCEAVFELLNRRGIAREYYRLRGRDRLRRLDERPARADYAYLDDPAFLDLYASDRKMKFFLEGAHCAACVYLVEKLPEFVKGVESARLELGAGVATVRVREGERFAEAARELEILGYQPHPVRDGEAENLQRRENRKLLIRVGVAGASAGNVMLMALPLYNGIEGALGEGFRWMNLALAVPALAYSAAPLYSGAWAALRARSISIDVPLALAIILGSFLSVVNLLDGSDHIYFDSLAALIFLILASRYALRRAQQKALGSAGLAQFLLSSTAERRGTSGEFETVSTNALKPGDVVLVRPGEAFPADGEILSGSGWVNTAVLTGESTLQRRSSGQGVFAGMTSEEGAFEVRVERAAAESRLGRILRETEEALVARAPVVAFTDRISKYLVSAVIALSVLAFGLGALESTDEGMNRMLAVLVVTCPCALALATPLAMTLAIGRAARAGILVRGADVIERLAGVERIYLDKTGTLTKGQPRVISWVQAVPDASVAEAILAIESRSAHPVGRAIAEHLRAELGRVPEVQVEDLREVPGTGPEAKIEGRRYRIRAIEPEEGGAPHLQGSSRIGVERDGERIVVIRIGDRLREDSERGVRELRDLGLEPWILSGDAPSVVSRIGTLVGIPPERALGGLSPEAKREIVSKDPASLMAGDGANDAVALATASVGIAVHGGVEVSLRAAQGYIRTPGVRALATLVTLGRETLALVRRNLAFSLIYNVTGVVLALGGMIDPLMAAILMPLSAFTVFVSSLIGTSRMRRALREAGA